jgi:hypothetical protein
MATVPLPWSDFRVEAVDGAEDADGIGTESAGLALIGEGFGTEAACIGLVAVAGEATGLLESAGEVDSVALGSSESDGGGADRSVV